MPQHWALLVSHISYSLTQHSTILNSSFWDEWALVPLQSFFKCCKDSPASWEVYLSLNPWLWVPQRHNRLQNGAASGRQPAEQPETQVSVNHTSAARAQGYPRTSAESNPSVWCIFPLPHCGVSKPQCCSGKKEIILLSIPSDTLAQQISTSYWKAVRSLTPVFANTTTPDT